MNSSTKLKPVAKIRKQQEKNAARLHGDMLRQAGKLQKQLDELIDYRDQYLKSFHLAAQSGLSAVQMQDYRLFINRLDVAIKQQQQSVASGRKNCEKSHENLIDKRSKSKIIEKVVESRQQLENEMIKKHEQRELEDLPNNNTTNRK